MAKTLRRADVGWVAAAVERPVVSEKATVFVPLNVLLVLFWTIE